MITQQRLHELFDYRSSDGALIKRSPRRGNTVGRECGSVNGLGYKNARVDGASYLAHRLVFLFHHGFLPKQVDHINGVKGDNRIENLRAASPSMNAMNRKKNSRNTSGAKNVTWRKRRACWEVTIHARGRRIARVSGIKDFSLAQMIAAELREEHHGQFANHGSF